MQKFSNDVVVVQKVLIDDPFNIGRILLLNFGEILICFFVIFQSGPPTKVGPTCQNTSIFYILVKGFRGHVVLLRKVWMKYSEI